MSDVAPPPPPPPAPAPPPPPPSAPPVSSERSALLGSIQGFNSNKLKKVKTNEKKPGDKPLAPSGGSSSASIGVSSSKPTPGGGPSGFGDIFAGGMPKLRSTGNKPTESSSSTTTSTPISKPAAPVVNKPSAPVANTSSPVKPAPSNVAKPLVTSISKPVIKQSTGVLRPAPVISKAPVINKIAAKPAPTNNNNNNNNNNSNNNNNTVPSVSKPAAPVSEPIPTPKPTPPVVDPSTIKSNNSNNTSPKPVMDLPPPIPKPTHDSISSSETTQVKPVEINNNNNNNNNNSNNNNSGVVSEHTILPGDGTRSVKNTPAAPVVNKPAAPVVNKPAGSTPANWVKPGSGPISPIGKVVQSASVQTAPPRKVVSSAVPLKPAPTITSKAVSKPPAPVNTSNNTTSSTSNPTTPTSVSSPKSPAVFNIPPPIAKPSAPKDQEEVKSTPAPVPPAVIPNIEPPTTHKEEQPPATTTTHKETHQESVKAPPANIQHQNSSNNFKISPRKNDSDELVCARCGGGIEGNHFKALDQAWHIEHFTCVECNTGIQNFVAHDGQPYCEVCYDRKFVVHKTCNMCDKPIYGTVVSAMNSTFHSECFKCSSCSSSFPDNEFYQYESKPWCAPCIQKMTKAKYEKCDYCNQEIDSKSDGVIKVLGCKYHNNNKCFVCFDCKTPFPNLNYYEIENHPMCYDCAIKH